MVFTLIDVFPAIKEHFSTLKQDCTNTGIVILFLYIPLTFALILVYVGAFISADILNGLMTSFSIFIGLITSLIILLSDKKYESIDDDHKTLIKHLSYNAIYELIIGLFILFFTTIIFFLLNKIYAATTDVWLIISSALLYFLVFNFIITLLMISKRFFTLIRGGINGQI